MGLVHPDTVLWVLLLVKRSVHVWERPSEPWDCESGMKLELRLASQMVETLVHAMVCWLGNIADTCQGTNKHPGWCRRTHRKPSCLRRHCTPLVREQDL